jgi:DNA-directed RNA polymerase subunit M/transcription elongation factor TFIIS
MRDYKLICPHCGQVLEASEDMLGETIDCPSCKCTISLPKSDINPASAHTSQPELSHPARTETLDCPYCGEDILAKAKKCKHCGEYLYYHTQSPPASPIAKKQTSGIPVCQQCDGTMKKTVISSGNCAGLGAALIVFCLGIVIAVIIPVIGWIIGPIICFGSLFMGGKRSKVWKCKKCGSFVNRA